MLKHRVIPILLYNSKMMVVKPKSFEHPGRNVGSLMQFVKTMDSRNVDELILLDIEATKESRWPLFAQLRDFTSELFCPLTLGGGIHSLEDIEAAFNTGADKVSLNSALLNKDLIKTAVKKYGSQAIVASVDVKRVMVSTETYKYKPTLNSGKNILDKTIIEFVQSLEDLGIGEILLTSIARDGTRIGYDKNLIKLVSGSVKIPVIASGGCAGFNDMAEALQFGASAVAASSMFLFTSLTPMNCSFYLDNHGWPSRVTP